MPFYDRDRRHRTTKQRHTCLATASKYIDIGVTNELQLPGAWRQMLQQQGEP